MRAIVQTEWGTLDTIKLSDMLRLQPLTTQILVRVKTVGVNLINYHKALGRMPLNSTSTSVPQRGNFSAIMVC